eukprot:269282-Rhodomonas_salina.1
MVVSERGDAFRVAQMSCGRTYCTSEPQCMICLEDADDVKKYVDEEGNAMYHFSPTIDANNGEAGYTFKTGSSGLKGTSAPKIPLRNDYCCGGDWSGHKCAYICQRCLEGVNSSGHRGATLAKCPNCRQAR